MVAISLYRGNLHKVPNVPRQWLMPARKISLKDFKILLRRRSRALSRVTTTNPNPNPSSEDHDKNEPQDENWVETGKDDCENKALEVLKSVEEEVEKEKPNGKNEMENVGVLEKLVEATESLVVEAKGGAVKDAAAVEIKANDLDSNPGRIDQQVEMKVESVDAANPSLEIAREEEYISDKQKRRQEIEEKLKILNEKKHSLVQALKQILNVEEELKRRSDIQGVAGQLPVGGGQVEGTHDSSSMYRHNTSRMGSEGNVTDEAGGAETNDANHNIHLRHLVRMSNTLLSSDTQQRKPTCTTATLPSRTNSGVANSPSRFALAGHQGPPPHLPSVSPSGTN